jgi:predicted 2-oxoglutarate/Fe(II)-dependent dioxygenase YbiX
MSERLAAIAGEYGLQFSKISAPQFTKYQESHFIAPHRDTRAAYPERVFSAVTYLTENYEGGEIEFPTIRRRFHPRQGETLVFPAEMLHAMRPVEAGEKQIFLFFIDRN